MDLQLQDPGTQLAVEKFVACIRAELNPGSSSSERYEAHMYCESFRSSEPPSRVAAVGIMLTMKPEVEIAFSGLRILEDLVKYNWATLECRDLVKRHLMTLLESGFSNLPSQPSFLKEALARTIVEIAKREWPQLWNDLVPVLLEMGHRNNLPYVVLRRLFEDISLIQGEDNVPRKRELMQSLVAIAKDMVPTLVKLLVESLERYAAGQSVVDLGKCKLFLGSILPFIELASLNLFTEDNRLTLLFQLLRHPTFKTDAADCILQFFNRKSSEKKEKARICNEMLLDINFMNYIEVIRQTEKNDVHFIRQLCDILAFISAHCEKSSSSLPKLFSAVECMASRSEITAVLGAATSFNHFLRTTVDSDDKSCLMDPQYSPILNNIINLIIKKLLSAPAREEKDEMIRLKCEFCTMLRSINRVWKKMYLLLSPWIVDAVSNAATMEVCQWEALGSVIDTVTSTVSSEDEDVVNLGLMHLERVFMTYSTEENLERKSAMLSSVSGLFVFLTLARRKREFTNELNNLMCSIIKSMFQCFSYPESERNIRRHVAALFIKLSRDNGELFLEMFPSILQETENIKSKLTSMEYVSLIESLLITSNRWEEKSQQLVFVSSLIIRNEWEEIEAICRSPVEFSTLFTEETFYQKRPLLFRNLNLLVAIFNRVQFPAESSFGCSTFVEDFFNFIRHTFPVILQLVRTLHSLVTDPNLAFLEDMNQGERNALLGFVDHSNSNEDSSRAPKSFKEKLHDFVRAIEDAAYSVLGACGPKFGGKLYSNPNIGDAFLSFTGSACAQMNDFQIRRILRTVYRPFLVSCPYDHAKQVIVPFIQQFGTFMANRLVSRWAAVDFDTINDENAPEAEVINNACLQLLTKDYFDMVMKLLELSNNTKEDLNKTIYESGGMEMDEEGMQNGHSKGHQSGQNVSELGEIGKLLMDDHVCQQCVIHLCAQALCWKHSQASLKAARIILVTLKYIWHYREVVEGLFDLSLRAMVMFSSNEANFDCLFRIADSILVEFYVSNPKILQLLNQWGAPEKEVMKLINLVQMNPTANTKKRKDVFKAILREHPEIAKNQGPAKQWLSQLPKLFICNPEKAGKREAAAKDVDLRECFSLIHIV